MCADQGKGQLDQPPIAIGRTAEVFAWGSGQVLKLYRPQMPGEWRDYEAKVWRIVVEAGLAAPCVLGTLKIEGRPGIVYQRVDGSFVLERMKTHPWESIRLARKFARLHAPMHAEERPELPSGRESLRRRIARAPHLSNPQRQQLLANPERLPDGRAVCHGDFHPGNVLITSRGTLVIDWMTACHGHPLADVARTMIILQGTGPLPEPLPVKLRILLAMRRMLQRVYLKEYFHLRPGCKERWSGGFRCKPLPGPTKRSRERKRSCWHGS